MKCLALAAIELSLKEDSKKSSSGAYSTGVSSSLYPTFDSSVSSSSSSSQKAKEARKVRHNSTVDF